MKIRFLIAYILTLSALNTKLIAQNFFPLQFGNKAQYNTDYVFHGPGGTQSGNFYGNYFIHEDSVINGETFYNLSEYQIYLFSNPEEQNFLFRIDTFYQKMYIKLPGDDTVRLAVDFNTPPDSSFISYIMGEPVPVISEGTDIDTIFETPVQTFKISYNTYNSHGNYIFADGFGIINHYDFGSSGTTWGSNDINIISAIIDSNIYNLLLLDITELGPLNDRPIDTFPFVLHGNYSATIGSLIDSFYVNIILSRADTIINNWRLEFVNGMVNVPITSSALQVGDKIKVRAKVTDESIFQNVAYFPDSGWALINVLPPILGVKTENELFKYKLDQNYPNPFNPSTNISFEVAENCKVVLKIFDVLGNKVKTLIDEEKSAGNYEIKFDGSSLPSGLYFYQIKAGDFINTKEMILIK